MTLDIEAIERRAAQPVNGVWASAGACRTDIRALLAARADLVAALEVAERAMNVAMAAAGNRHQLHEACLVARAALIRAGGVA